MLGLFITQSFSNLATTVEISTLGYYRLVAVNVVAKLCGSAHGHYLIAMVSNMAGASCEYHYLVLSTIAPAIL